MQHDPLEIAILALQVTIVGWLLAHSLQCAKRNERVKALEDFREALEKKEREQK